MTAGAWRALFLTQIAMLLGTLVFFWIYPAFDLYVSGWFYYPGEGFYLKDNLAIRAFYRGIPFVLKILGGAAALLLVYNVVAKEPIGRIHPRIYLYLVLTLALGPGLLVNGILKEHWGRARPVQVIEFGGERHYSPPLIPSDQCPRNCSFISGHAASGFYAFAFALLATRRRVAAMAASIGFGMFASFGRVAQGGHFFSDVLLAGMTTCLIATMLYGLLVRDRQR